MRDVWNYTILILLYNLSENAYLAIGGGPADSKLSSNRYNTHPQQQEKIVDESLCLNTKAELGAPAVTFSAPEMALHIASTQSQIGADGAENSLQHDHQVHKSSYNLLSEAMSQAVSHEFSK